MIAIRCNLLEWKIDQVEKCLSKDDIFVSSSSDEILAIATSCAVNVIKRKSTIDVEYKQSFGDIITDIVKDVDREHIVWISPTHPFMNDIDYSKAISIYEKIITECTHDSLMSVFKMNDYIWIGDKSSNYTANKNQEYR
jgi:CMP-N-acetylneuraminic acid synthetase